MQLHVEFTLDPEWLDGGTYNIMKGNRHLFLQSGVAGRNPQTLKHLIDVCAAYNNQDHVKVMDFNDTFYVSKDRGVFLLASDIKLEVL